MSKTSEIRLLYNMYSELSQKPDDAQLIDLVHRLRQMVSRVKAILAQAEKHIKSALDFMHKQSTVKVSLISSNFVCVFTKFFVGFVP